MRCPDRVQTATAVCGAQPELHGDHVWPPALYERQQLLARVRRPNDLDVLDAFQRPPKSLEHEPVVVRDQNLHDYQVLRVIFRAAHGIRCRNQCCGVSNVRPPDRATTNVADS